MRPHTIIMAAATALVLGGLVFLFTLVTGDPDDAVSADKLAEARQRHERAQAAKTTAADPPRKIPPRPQDRAPDVGQDEDEGPPPEPWQARSTPAHAPDLHAGDINDDLAARLDEAQTLYRSRKYKEAMEQAIELLDEVPDNLQLKRIVVRSACIEGDARVAGEYIEQVPERDKTFLYSHCKRYGVELE